MSTPVLQVGLTGGIASGKSTVSRHLAKRGAFIVDADAIAREVVEPGGLAYDGVVDAFGREILDADGRIVRPRLAQRVFGDAEALAELNAIVHPKVRYVARRAMQRCADEQLARIAIYDAALLIETRAHQDLHRLIVLRCSAETQIARLAARDGMDRAAAVARISAQAPLDEKLELADYVIDTDQALEATLAEVDAVWTRLEKDWLDEFGR